MSVNELVINYHMTENCNYRCGFCYAHWDDKAKRSELHRCPGAIENLLKILSDYFLADNPLRRRLNYQSVRLNFAGGEPILLGKRFHSAVVRARELGFSCSVITNGHFVDELFVSTVAPKLSIVGISYDSAIPEIQTSMGRCDRVGRVLSPLHLLQILEDIRRHNPQVQIKLNTVVNRLNRDDDLNEFISWAVPDKWKIMRVLPVHGDDLTVTSEQFLTYVQRHHQHAERIALEDNQSMKQSYLMINPQGCFYQNGELRGGYTQSRPISEVGVAAALGEITFDPVAFLRRYTING